MYKVEIQREKFEEAAIQRRRKLQEDLKSRFFDPKQRSMGIDVQVLDQQVQMKKESKELEKKREEHFDNSIKATNMFLEVMDKRVNDARRHRSKEVETFRVQNQKPFMSREYDLNDPKMIAKDKPPRLDESNSNTSNLQTFMGEDWTYADRVNYQKEQMKTWIAEQIHTKQDREKAENDEKKRYADFEKLILHKLNVMNDEVNDARRQQAKFDSDYNLRLAADKKQRLLAQKLYEERVNALEMEAVRSGVFSADANIRFERGVKVPRDLYRGMDEQELQEIRNVQAQQRMEAQIIKNQEKDISNRFATQANMNHRALVLIEREKERQVRQEAVSTRLLNQQFAEQEKARESIEKAAHTGPTEEYFAQFNRDCR